ncbi:hypothetical protein [Acetobacter persici]|uniref:hypothetical protein n=1 Tax=Acetobacter persici TaxID=1076596 RepID=UPI001F40EDBC|nr:hypothetical protein [Acetobacter persici]MCG0998179.1 hypothetical protein [Acetobacter persici]
MARKEFRPRRKQYEEKNPMAAFWAQTATNYDFQSDCAHTPGQRIWAKDRARECRKKAQQAELAA